MPEISTQIQENEIPILVTILISSLQCLSKAINYAAADEKESFQTSSTFLPNRMCVAIGQLSRWEKFFPSEMKRREKRSCHVKENN